MGYSAAVLRAYRRPAGKARLISEQTQAAAGKKLLSTQITPRKVGGKVADVLATRVMDGFDAGREPRGVGLTQYE